MDNRSKRVVFLSHCILNTNTMAQNLGIFKKYPSSVVPVINLLLKNNVGIVQMPCPEKVVLGLVRNQKTKNEMPEEELRKECRLVVKNVCNEIEDYLNNNFEVLCIIGKRGSPVCAVKECWVSKGNLVQTMGFLMDEINRELKVRNLDIPLIDYDKDFEHECLEEIESHLQ
jgi:predicted secreted protein